MKVFQIYLNTIINIFKDSYLNIQYTSYFLLMIIHNRNKGKLILIIVQLQTPKIQFTYNTFEMDEICESIRMEKIETKDVTA